MLMECVNLWEDFQQIHISVIKRFQHFTTVRLMFYHSVTQPGFSVKGSACVSFTAVHVLVHAAHRCPLPRLPSFFPGFLEDARGLKIQEVEDTGGIQKYPRVAASSVLSPFPKDPSLICPKATLIIRKAAQEVGKRGRA